MPVRRIAVRVMCHNEEPTIVGVVDRSLGALAAAGYAPEVEVIDDGSTDGSGEALHESFAGDARVSVRRHPTRLGIGGVLRQAFRPTESDAVVLLCGDLQFAPEDLPALLAGLADADLVTARRKKRRDRWPRRLLTEVERLALGVRFGCDLPDVHWVRAVRGPYLADLHLRSDSPSIDVELALHVRRRGGRLVSLPLPHHPRAYGQSKTPLLRLAWRSAVDLLRLR